MRYALAALAIVDVLFVLVLAAVADARLSEAAGDVPLFVGLCAVFACVAAVFVVRACAYHAYWHTATLYASSATHALASPLPAPASIVDGNRSAAHYSAVVVALLLAGVAGVLRGALLAAWAVACAANLAYARLADDRPALRRAVRELLDDRLAQTNGDPVRSTWSAAELGASAARLPPPMRAADNMRVLDDDDDDGGGGDWSSIRLSEDTSAAMPRRAAQPPPAAAADAVAATTSSSDASTPSSESSTESDAASGVTEMLFDGTLGSRALREKYDAALRSR